MSFGELNLTSYYKRRVPAHLIANWFGVTSSSLLSKYVKIKIHRTISSSVVLNGCENWSFTLRDECRLARV